MDQMKLILSQYKLIVQAFKHHNLEKKFVQGILMYHFEKKTLKNLEIFSFLNLFFEFFFKYIHEQSTSNATWIFRIQRNIETWNKQRNKL